MVQFGHGLRQLLWLALAAATCNLLGKPLVGNRWEGTRQPRLTARPMFDLHPGLNFAIARGQVVPRSEHIPQRLSELNPFTITRN